MKLDLMKMQDQFKFLSIALLSFVSLYPEAATGVRIGSRTPPLCTRANGYCHAFVRQEDTFSPPKIMFEISCDCSTRKDISENLIYLEEVMCPHVPNHVDDKPVDESLLFINNCDIEKQEFPVELLSVLRRSKRFEIFIKGAERLRLPTDFMSNGKTDAVINATIINSHINGLGKGWFSGGPELTLKMINSSIGIVDSGFLSTDFFDAIMNVDLQDTKIETLLLFGISLPPNGNFHMRGGRVSQIEKHGFEGGNEISIENVVFGSISEAAFNLLNVKSFTLASSHIAKVDKKFLVSNHLHGRVISEHSESEIGTVIIKGNKFMKVHKEAFSGLCNEKSLIFENNFMQEVEFVPMLESESCSYKRDWMTSVWGNGFNCDVSSNLCDAFKRSTEQNCVFFRTSWCLCQSAANTESPSSTDAPCKKSVKKYLQSKCHHSISQQLDDNCPALIIIDNNDPQDKTPEETDDTQGRALYQHSGAVKCRSFASASLVSVLALRLLYLLRGI